MGDYQDDVHYAEANGSAFEYSFVGTGIDWFTETHSSQGEAEVYVDGILVDTVDTFQADGRGVQQKVYGVRDLPNGTHTLRVEAPRRGATDAAPSAAHRQEASVRML